MALWPSVTLDLDPSEEKTNDTTTGIQIGVCATLYSIAVVFVCARLYVRAFMIKTFGIDDGFLLLGLMSLSGGFSAMVVQSHNGLGRHIDIIPLEQALTYRLAGWVMNFCISTVGLGILKTAIGLNLLRFCRENVIWPWYKRLVWSTLVFVWIYTAVLFSYTWSQCQPLAKFWDTSIKHGKCVSIAEYTRWGTANCAMNITTDVLFATLPMPVVWRIRLPVRVRAYLIGVLSLGCIAVVFGIVRVIFILDYANAPKDRTYHIGPPFWAFLELSIGFITASCVALKPLLSKIVRLHDTHYGVSGSFNITTIGGSGGGASKARSGFAEIHLDEVNDQGQFQTGDLRASRVRKQRKASMPIAGNSFYDTGTGDSGSEEAIMSRPEQAQVKDDLEHFGAQEEWRIRKTTRVEVTYAN